VATDRAAALTLATTQPSPFVTTSAMAATLEIHSPPSRAFAAKPARPVVPTSYLIVKVTSTRTIRSHPGWGRVIGGLPARSRWITSPLSVWVLDVSRGGRYGKVAVPWSPTRQFGWFDMRGLRRTRTKYQVVASLSHHTLSLYRSGRRVFTVPTATGAPASPTPPGFYFVTDRSPWNPSTSYGSFIFGLSGIQTHLPSGWSGGNLLAIHGTNDPSSVGRSASAGCLRVSRATLERLQRVLVLGAPVIVRA
jgi:lipoprotein-anchoring transpeptidase ErfK/SrfK